MTREGAGRAVHAASRPAAPDPRSIVDPFELVLFDLDGVLIDSFEAWRGLLNDTLAERGSAPLSRGEFARTWGQDVEADRKLFFSDWTLERLSSHYAERFPRYVDRIETMRGAPEVLGELRRRGKKVAVATNSPGPIVRRILDARGLLESLDWVASVDQVRRGKPEPDLLHHILELSGVAAERACYVGDSVFDEAAARAAGIFFIGLRRAGDATVQDLEDLIAGS